MSTARSLLMTLAILSAASAGCLLPAGPSAPLTVELAPGGSAAYKTLTVRFVGVTADSRCPADALCIQQGDAFFTVEARARGSAATQYELQVNDPQHRRVVHAGYAIEADTLFPYPFASVPTVPEDYRLTLTVEKE
jgi:hypothetical protein